MTDICDGCEGDKFCQIQDDMGHPDYSCPINSKWAEVMDKLKAVKKWVETCPEWGKGGLEELEKILEDETLQSIGESPT